MGSCGLHIRMFEFAEEFCAKSLSDRWPISLSQVNQGLVSFSPVYYNIISLKEMRIGRV